MATKKKHKRTVKENSYKFYYKSFRPAKKNSKGEGYIKESTSFTRVKTPIAIGILLANASIINDAISKESLRQALAHKQKRELRIQNVNDVYTTPSVVISDEAYVSITNDLGVKRKELELFTDVTFVTALFKLLPTTQEEEDQKEEASEEHNKDLQIQAERLNEGLFGGIQVSQ